MKASEREERKNSFLSFLNKMKAVRNISMMMMTDKEEC
jgi:hypothetical protein